MGKIRPLTHSMIKTFNECEMKYYHSYVRLRKVKFIKFPFFVGGCMHEGILTLFRTKDLKFSIASAEVMIQDYRKTYEKEASFSAENEQEFQYQAVTIEAMLKGYYKYRKAWINKLKVIVHEHTFKSEDRLPGRFVKIAKPDAVIEHPTYLSPALYELKTAKSMKPEYLKINLPQCINYFNTVNPIIPLNAICIDAVQKPMIRINKNESEKEFILRLEKYYEDDDKFNREFIETPSISKRMIRQYQDLVLYTAERIVHAEDLGEFRCNRYACNIFGQCEFFSLCDWGANPIQLMKYEQKTSVNEELEF